jgi:hypothetical protein
MESKCHMDLRAAKDAGKEGRAILEEVNKTER